MSYESTNQGRNKVGWYETASRISLLCILLSVRKVIAYFTAIDNESTNECWIVRNASRINLVSLLLACSESNYVFHYYE